jgi:hypothetical protein
VVLSDMSGDEEGCFELDSDDSFNDSFKSDERNEESDPGDQPEELENLHAFHSCSCCRFIDFDSNMFTRNYLWAKMRTHPSYESEDCELFRFCREQCVSTLHNAALYIYIEHMDGHPFTGSKVGFTFSTNDTILPGQTFLTGSIHSGK